MACTCQKCGKLYKSDILVSDEIWEAIRCDRNLMCGICIIDAVEELFGYSAFNLVEIKSTS